MKNKIRLFMKYNFFSLRVLLSDFILYLQNLLSVNKIRFKEKDIKFYASSEMSTVRAVLFGKKEKEVYEFIDKYLNNGEIFFDIGANVGVFSIYASIFKNAKSYAFEPEYSNLYLLNKNIHLNNLHNIITICPYAVSNDIGYGNLYLSSLESGAALHSLSKKIIEVTDENSPVVANVSVYSITIDDYVKKNNIVPKMIKIDTDGKELEILIGATETLKKVTCLALELPIDQNKKDKCIAILSEANFIEDKDLAHGRNVFFIKK